MSDAPMTEEQLRVALMQADLDLKRKQGFWETPRNIAILLGVAIALTGTAAGIVGFRLGSAPPQQINVHLDAPLILPRATP